MLLHVCSIFYNNNRRVIIVRRSHGKEKHTKFKSNMFFLYRTQAMTILQSLYNAKIFSDIKDDSNRTDANDPRQFLDNNKIFKYISFLFF